MDFDIGPVNVDGLAVLAAAAASVVIGGVWFGPLFGRRWSSEMELGGVSEAAKQAQLPRAMLLMMLGSLFQAAALRLLLATALPAFGLSESGRLGWAVALGAGFVVWLGFFVPVQLGRVAWEGRSWSLFQINSAFYLLTLLVMAAILGLWP